MNRWLFLILFLIVYAHSYAQKPLKKKYLGKYQGVIGSYKINTGSQFIDVAETTVSVDLQKNDLIFKIGRNSMTTPYSSEKKDKKSYLIRFTRDVDQTPEVLVLNKKTKEIVREGVSPQPNSKLLKVKKKSN
jgi:hypothetical protein